MTKQTSPDTKEITLGQRTIRYSIIRSSRTSITISVDLHGSVKVRVPKRASENSIIDLVASKAGWIAKHLERIEAQPAPPVYSYTEGELHPLLGKMVPLRIRKTGKNRVATSLDRIDIEYTEKWDAENGRMAMETLYKLVARKVFPERLEIMIKKSASHNLAPSKLKIRNMKSRWGSCSTSGSVTLSSRLVAKRVELIDYVILHELCHLRHHNHGPDFYALLKELSPNYKELRKELKAR